MSRHKIKVPFDKEKLDSELNEICYADIFSADTPKISELLPEPEIRRKNLRGLKKM